MGFGSRGWSAKTAGFVLAAVGCSGSDDAQPSPRTAEADAAVAREAGGGSGGSANGGEGGTGTSGTAGTGGSGAGSGSGGMLGTSAGAADGSADAAGTGSDAAASCLDRLAAAGVGYQRVSAKGVVDAVELTGRLNGILIANGTSENPTRDPIACQFVETLMAFANLLKERGFDRIGTLGSYCYRCCCAWSETNFCRGPDDPEPDCGADGFSNHSWGRAIDVRYLYKPDGTRYDVNDTTHFVQWTSAGETCSAALAAQTGISRELYQLVCEASARRLFSTVLTPNYNAAHRNHFHLDIGQSGSTSGFIVRSIGSESVDLALDGDE